MSKIRIGVIVEVGATSIETFLNGMFKVKFGDVGFPKMLLPELKDLKGAIETMIAHLEYLEKLNNG